MTAAIPHINVGALTERAKNILTKPPAEWDKIAGETTSLQDLLIGYVAPLAAIPAICTFVGSLVFGYGYGIRPSFVGAFGHMIAMYVLNVIGVVVAGFAADFLAPHFGGQSNRSAAFRLAVYSMTAAFLAGAFDILPPALRFLSIVGVYSFYLFYLGAPKLMKVPADKSVVYTVVTILGTGIVAGVIGAILLHT